MHTLLDLRGNIPTSIHISGGKPHEAGILDQLSAALGAFYVLDRGLLDFTRLCRFHDAGGFFAACGKSNLKGQRRSAYPVDRATGLICDRKALLTGFYALKVFFGASGNAVKLQSCLAVSVTFRFRPSSSG